MRSSLLLAALGETAAAFSATPPEPQRGIADLHTVTRSFTLTGEGLDPNKCIVHEVRCQPPNPDAEEDEVELMYPTTRRAFVLPGHEKVLNIRQTSFGCGRLGATVWPSAIALASLLASDQTSLVNGKRLMELGSGCGLPSLVAKEICGAEKVLATDYWEVTDDDTGRLVPADAATEGRLVPKDLFGANLAYNIKADGIASIGRLDWHDEMETFKTANSFLPDLIIGSDLVYYPSDSGPLLQTLNILLKAGDKPKDALLILPLPPGAEREALPVFRERLQKGELGSECEVVMDDLELVETRHEEQRHHLLRIRIHRVERS